MRYTPIKIDDIIIKRHPLSDDEKNLKYEPKIDKQYENRLDQLYLDFHKLHKEFTKLKIVDTIDGEINGLKAMDMSLKTFIDDLRKDLGDLEVKLRKEYTDEFILVRDSIKSVVDINIKNVEDDHKELDRLFKKYCLDNDTKIKNLEDSWTIDKSKTNQLILNLDFNIQILDNAIKYIDIELQNAKRQIGYYTHDEYAIKRRNIRKII